MQREDDRSQTVFEEVATYGKQLEQELDVDLV